MSTLDVAKTNHRPTAMEHHQENMSVKYIPPYTPLLYSKTGVCRGIVWAQPLEILADKLQSIGNMRLDL